MKTYRTNRLLAFVITVVLIAGVFSIDIDRLLRFYENMGLLILVIFVFVLIPLFLFFGFSVSIDKGQVIYRHNGVFRKVFRIEDLSHILYHPTWRGLMGMNSSTNMRSLHVVRNSGGWRETISLTNGAFREQDLADIASELHRLNPRAILDEHTSALIKKYESGSK